MNFIERNSVKVLLLNDAKELLLIYADHPSTTTVDGIYHGPFWLNVGGEIEQGETLQEAAIREVFEETGIRKEQVALGPVVWFGEFDLLLAGRLTRLKPRFIVAKTSETNVSFQNITKAEKTFMKKAAWFSLDQITNSSDIIYPIVLPQYLPDILKGKYPKRPIEIDLSKQPV